MELDESKWFWMKQSKAKKICDKYIRPAEQYMLSLSVYDARWNLNETGFIVLLLLFLLLFFFSVSFLLKLFCVSYFTKPRAQNANNFKRVFLLLRRACTVYNMWMSIRTTPDSSLILYSVYEILFLFFLLSCPRKTCLNCEYFLTSFFFLWRACYLLYSFTSLQRQNANNRIQYSIYFRWYFQCWKKNW